MDFVAWHDRNGADHTAQTNKYFALGYRFLSLSIYDEVTNPLYAAVMVLRTTIYAQNTFQAQTPAQFQQTFDAQAKLGFGPIIIAATGTAQNPLFASVFEELGRIPLTRFGLSEAEFASLNAAQMPGSILSWAAIYGDANQQAYAAIWMPNPGNTPWNADGLAETQSVAQERFDAQTSAYNRLRFITTSQGQQYLTVYSDDQIGEWIAQDNLTSAGYQTAFNQQTAAGFFPLLVQAAGVGAAARFSVIFAKQETVNAKEWMTPTGSPAIPAIDQAMQKLMTTYRCRAASLAVTKGSRLVLARGYTNIEPGSGFPVTQPLTYFRIASCSKTITALGIHVLIQRGTIYMTQPIQSILHLTLPDGKPPVDPYFNSITVQNLLEMDSGLPTDFAKLDPQIVAAFNAVPGHAPYHLPATEPQIASYVVGLPGAVEPGTNNPAKPGDVDAYSNFGYFMLGRIIATVMKTDYFDAVTQLVLKPLGINTSNSAAAGIRVARSLVADQQPNEARYQSLNLVLNPSVMSDSQPLVSQDYGDECLETGAAAGGLSASAPALARVVAFYSSQAASPAIPELPYAQTEAILQASSTSYRGHGFDSVTKVGTAWQAQKGGSLETSQDCLSFTVGDIGLVVLWNAEGIGGDWYPFFPEVVTAAQSYDFGTTDLFPSFGMKSF